jgi:TDG/mug DNA glycosylase family protein
VKQYTPKILAVLGIEAFRKAFDRPKALLGRQEERLGETIIWILPNPSGLNAHYQLDDLVELFKKLRRAS